MAALVLGLAGAGVGSMFGMTSLGWTIGSSIGNLLFNNQPDQEGPRLTDMTVTSSTYGTDIPQVFGAIRIAGNVIWSTNKIETVHRQDIESGGKGGSFMHTPQQITYTYHVNLAVAFADGQVRGVRNIWANGKLIYTVGAAETTQVPGPNGQLVTETVYTATALQVESDNAAQTNMTFYKGTEDQLPDATIQSWVGANRTPAFRGTAYVVFMNFQLEEYGNVIPNFEFEVIADEGTTTGSIVKHFCNKAGLTDDQLDVTTLTQPVQGYKIATRGPARAAIEPLANIFFFDAVQSDGKVKFITRGSGIQGSIPQNDLAAHEPGNDRPDPLKPLRKNEEELPQEIGIVFINRNNNYLQGTQYHRRQVTRSKTQVKLDVPIVLLDSEAKGIAQTLVHAAWVSRTSFTFMTSRKYAKYEPTDVLAVSNNGSVYTIRVTEKNDNKPGIIEWTGEFEDTGQWSYTPNNQLDRFNAPTSFIQDPGDVTDPVIFGAPSQLTATGFEIWIAAASPDPEWGGCDVWISTDDLYFTPVGRIHSASIKGVLSAALPAHVDPDSASTLSVDLTQSEGVLVTVSQDQLDRFNSLCYVDGELVGYKTSTPSGAHAYNLTNLRRGVYNTLIETHPIGAPFVSLSGEILRHTYNPVLLGQTLYFRFTSFNTHRLQLQDVATATSYTYVVGGSIGHPDNTTGITASIEPDGQIRLTIVPVADPRIKRYEIRQGAVWETATPVASIVEPDTYAHLPPQPISTYTWLVKSINDQGQYSLTAQSVTLTVSSPAAVTSLTASTNGLFYVDLNWVFATGQTDRSAIEIYGATTNNRATAGILTHLLPNETHFRHVGTSAGQDWWYWILLYDSAGNPSAFFPASATAGVNGRASTDPSAILTLLQNSVNLAQLHPDIQSKVTLVIQPENIAHASGEAWARANDAAEAALTLLLETDTIKTGLDREKWISDATVVVDPSTGKVTLIATADITTDVENRLHVVEVDLDAVTGTVSLHTTSIDNLNGTVSTHTGQITALQGSIALKVEASYVDAKVDSTLAGLDPTLLDITSNAGAVAILRALVDSDFSRIQAQKANASVAAANRTLTANADQIAAEAVERSVIAAQTASNLAAIIQESSSRTTADAANAQTSVDILARLNTGDFATVKSQAAAATTATGSQATLISDISARLNTGDFATVKSNATAAVATGNSNASSITDLQVRLNSGDFATVKSTVSGLVTSTGATATSVGDLQVRLDTGDFAAVKTSAAASVTRLGTLESRWSLKVQAGNVVAGMEVVATGATSSIAILADQFLFLKPDGTGTPIQVMTLGTVGGVSTLGLSGNLIIDGSIVPSRIDTRGLVIRDTDGTLILGSGVPLDYNTRVSNRPTSLAGINSTEGSKLSGIQAGATAGADYATNVTNRPTALGNINATESARFYGIEAGATVGADWVSNLANRPSSLSGINTTEASKLAGIASGATVGADWTTNVTNRPVTLSSINGAEGSKLAGIQDGADVTSSHTAASVAGQGAFATLSQITATNVSTYIANVAIQNAQIGGSLFSDNYVAGTSGWAIAKDGTVEFNNGLFRGVLAAATGTFGTVAIASGGYVRMGQTIWNDTSNSGFFIGDSGGQAALSLYDVTTGQFLAFKPGVGLIWKGSDQQYTPGFIVISSAPTIRTTDSTSYVQMKSFSVAHGGTLKVGFNFGARWNGQGHELNWTASAIVQVKDSTNSTVKYQTSEFVKNIGEQNAGGGNVGLQTYTDAITVDVPVVAGDLVNISLHKNAGTLLSGATVTAVIDSARIMTGVPTVETVLQD